MSSELSQPTGIPNPAAPASEPNVWSAPFPPNPFGTGINPFSSETVLPPMVDVIKDEAGEFDADEPQAAPQGPSKAPKGADKTPPTKGVPPKGKPAEKRMRSTRNAAKSEGATSAVPSKRPPKGKRDVGDERKERKGRKSRSPSRARRGDSPAAQATDEPDVPPATQEPRDAPKTTKESKVGRTPDQINPSIPTPEPRGYVVPFGMNKPELEAFIEETQTKPLATQHSGTHGHPVSANVRAFAACSFRHVVRGIANLRTGEPSVPVKVGLLSPSGTRWARYLNALVDVKGTNATAVAAALRERDLVRSVSILRYAGDEQAHKVLTALFPETHIAARLEEAPTEDLLDTFAKYLGRAPEEVYGQDVLEHLRGTATLSWDVVQHQSVTQIAQIASVSHNRTYQAVCCATPGSSGTLFNGEYHYDVSRDGHTIWKIGTGTSEETWRAEWPYHRFTKEHATRVYIPKDGYYTLMWTKKHLTKSIVVLEFTLSELPPDNATAPDRLQQVVTKAMDGLHGVPTQQSAIPAVRHHRKTAADTLGIKLNIEEQNECDARIMQALLDRETKSNATELAHGNITWSSRIKRFLGWEAPVVSAKKLVTGEVETFPWLGSLVLGALVLAAIYYRSPFSTVAKDGGEGLLQESNNKTLVMGMDPVLPVVGSSSRIAADLFHAGLVAPLAEEALKRGVAWAVSGFRQPTLATKASVGAAFGLVEHISYLSRDQPSNLLTRSAIHAGFTVLPFWKGFAAHALMNVLFVGSVYANHGTHDEREALLGTIVGAADGLRQTMVKVHELASGKLPFMMRSGYIPGAAIAAYLLSTSAYSTNWRHEDSAEYVDLFPVQPSEEPLSELIPQMQDTHTPAFYSVMGHELGREGDDSVAQAATISRTWYEHNSGLRIERPYHVDGTTDVQGEGIHEAWILKQIGIMFPPRLPFVIMGTPQGVLNSAALRHNLARLPGADDGVMEGEVYKRLRTAVCWAQEQTLAEMQADFVEHLEGAKRRNAVEALVIHGNGETPVSCLEGTHYKVIAKREPKTGKFDIVAVNTGQTAHVLRHNIPPNKRIIRLVQAMPEELLTLLGPRIFAVSKAFLKAQEGLPIRYSAGLDPFKLGKFADELYEYWLEIDGEKWDGTMGSRYMVPFWDQVRHMFSPEHWRALADIVEKPRSVCKMKMQSVFARRTARISWQASWTQPSGQATTSLANSIANIAVSSAVLSTLALKFGGWAMGDDLIVGLDLEEPEGAVEYVVSEYARYGIRAKAKLEKSPYRVSYLSGTYVPIVVDGVETHILAPKPGRQIMKAGYTLSSVVSAAQKVRNPAREVERRRMFLYAKFAPLWWWDYVPILRALRAWALQHGTPPTPKIQAAAEAERSYSYMPPPMLDRVEPSPRIGVWAFERYGLDMAALEAIEERIVQTPYPGVMHDDELVRVVVDADM